MDCSDASIKPESSDTNPQRKPEVRRPKKLFKGRILGTAVNPAIVAPVIGAAIAAALYTVTHAPAEKLSIKEAERALKTEQRKGAQRRYLEAVMIQERSKEESKNVEGAERFIKHNRQRWRTV